MTQNLSSDEAIELLAQSLNRAQGKLDPDGFDSWEEYDERDKQFFRSTIRSLLLDRELWEAAF